MQTMTANFSQTDARGRVANGTLQMKRPGRVRFAYNGGDPPLVADGKTLTFLDHRSGRNRAGRWAGRRSGAAASGSPDFNGKADPAQQRPSSSLGRRATANMGS